MLKKLKWWHWVLIVFVGLPMLVAIFQGGKDQKKEELSATTSRYRNDSLIITASQKKMLDAFKADIEQKEKLIDGLDERILEEKVTSMEQLKLILPRLDKAMGKIAEAANQINAISIPKDADPELNSHLTNFKNGIIESMLLKGKGFLEYTNALKKLDADAMESSMALIKQGNPKREAEKTKVLQVIIKD